MSRNKLDSKIQIQLPMLIAILEVFNCVEIKLSELDVNNQNHLSLSKEMNNIKKNNKF